MSVLRVDVWSDIACPWCYVGKRRLETALSLFPHAAETVVVWRAFELDPAAPRERPRNVTYAERLAKKYGSSVPQAQARIERMTTIAAAEGLPFDFERARPGNTFDAHRVLHMAANRGGRAMQDAVKERFLRGYMTEGAPIGDRDTLAELAADAGLDPDDVRAALAGDAFAREVRADQEEARDLGIDGVPFFLFGGRYAVSGAQPADLLLRALNESWKAVTAAAAESQSGSDSDAVVEGDACGPDGCP